MCCRDHVSDRVSRPNTRSDGYGITRVRRLPPVSARQSTTAVIAPKGYCLIAINHAAMTGPCGPRPRPPGAGGGASAGGAGAGPRSGWNRYTLCVLVSTQIVFAPANVGTVSTTVYLSGES